MSGPSENLLILNSQGLNALWETDFASDATPSLCASLEGLNPQDPSVSGFSITSPAVIELSQPSAQPGPVSLFRPSEAPASDAALPDLMESSSQDLERMAREGYERDMRDQVGQLLRDFPACAVHGLADNYSRLPRFLQEVWVDYADDPRVGFRIDYVRDRAGALVPRIEFIRRSERMPAPAFSIRTQEKRGGFDGTDIPTVAAAGVLLTRLPSPANPEPPSAGGRGPNSIMISNPILGTAVTVGTGVLIYVAVDRQVQAMDMPPAVRSLFATGETALIYGGAARLGIIEPPQWGNVLRAAPHLALLQIGSSYVFDELGLPRGSAGNNLASFGLSTTAYVGLPRLAGRFPRIANLYRASIGLPLEGAATATAFRGSGLITGGLRFAGAVGTVFLIDWLGGSLGEFMVWAGDGFKQPAPDARLWRTALESFYADFANNAGGFAGWSARNLPFINKAAIGWARALSSGFERDFSGAVNGVIDRWVNGTNDFAEAMNNGFLLCALQSFDKKSDGSLELDWTAFQLHLNELFRREHDVVAAGYRMESLIRPTYWGDRITETSYIADRVSSDGGIRDQAKFRQHVQSLFDVDYYSNRLPAMLETIIREERRSFEDRLGELHLLSSQSDRPLRESQLNSAQRNFLHGDGRTSEASVRRNQIEVLNQLLQAFKSRSQSRRPNAVSLGQ